MRDIPPRRRPGSSPDVEVLPESAYQLLRGLQTSVDGLGQKVDANKRDTDQQIASLGLAVAQVKANDRAHIVKIASIVAGAAVSIIGTIIAARPTPPAPVQVLTPNALANDLEACNTLPESNRLVCQQAAAERDRLRRGGVPGR